VQSVIRCVDAGSHECLNPNYVCELKISFLSIDLMYIIDSFEQKFSLNSILALCLHTHSEIDQEMNILV